MSKDKLRVVGPDERLPEGDREIAIHCTSKNGDKHIDTYPVNSDVCETEDGKLVVAYYEGEGDEKVQVVVTYNYGEWSKTVERIKVK